MTELRQQIIQDPDDPTRLARFDTLIKTLVVQEEAHGHIHEGESFALFMSNSIGNGGTLVAAFKTPAANKRAHMVFDFTSSKAGAVSLIEGPTWDASSGSLVTIYNRKRDLTGSLMEQDNGGAFAATHQVLQDPTTFAGGTALHTRTVTAVAGAGLTASRRDASEWILKPATQYGIVYTSTAAVNVVELFLNWYEHTDE